MTGLDLLIVTFLVEDQADSAPLLSVAMTRTRYVPAWLQVCGMRADIPEFTSPVCEVLPSPQSKV